MRTQGKKFTLESLLGPRGADLVPLYQGGAVCIARLAPQDYHRWHMPVTGVLGPRYRISGALYTVNPVAVRQKLDVYTENEREVRRRMHYCLMICLCYRLCAWGQVCVINDTAFGKVVLVAIGATVVGSINVLGNEGDAIR